MAKNLNQISLKDSGGTGNLGDTVNKKKSGRKENLPDLTTSFANALTQGVNSLAQKAASVPTDNSATKSLVGSKASPVIQNDARKQQNTTAKTVAKNVSTGVKKNLESLDQKLGDTTSAAMSSLAGTTTPNQNRELYDYQNRHGGNIVTSTRAKREAEKAGTWDYLSWLNEKAGEVPNVATASLVGSNASPETIQAAQEQQNRPVTQLTEWATGNEFADALINLDDKAEAHRNKAEQLQQEAYDKYGQYENGTGQYIDEVVSSAASNAIRWGKRAALMALGVPMELLNATTDASMFMSAAGDAVREAEEMGSSDTATAIHALISGAAEAGFEHLTDPLNMAGYSFGVGDAVDNAIKKSALKPAMKFLLTLGAHAKLEGVEELFTEAVQGLSRKYALGQNISGKEVALDSLKADLAGTLSSFLLMGLGGDADYTQYKEDLAMYYWNMSEEQKTDVAELLGNAFGKDPALIRRSMDDRAFDQIEQMDGQTLMRAVNKAPVYIDPATNASVYEVTKYTKDQQIAQDFANRLGKKMNAVEDIEALTDDNGAKYINDGLVMPDDTILISAASETPIQDTLFHEVVHDGRDTPEGQEFINFAQEVELAERGAEGYQEYYNEVADVYKNAYDPNSAGFDSKVKEEIAAKFTKRLANDPDTMERIYRRNGNMFQRIYQGIRDAVASFDNTDDFTDEQKTLLKTEKLYSDMLKRMRRDALLNGMGLGDGEVFNMQTIKDNLKELVNRGERGEPMTNAGQVAYSLTMDKDLMQRAKEVNRESKFVAEDVMEIAEQQRLAVQSLMSRPKVLAVLPADDTTTNGKANTKMKNGSYGISEENTTVCVRMMSNEYVLDRIAERIGRPLNVSESLKISQMFMQWAAKAQCLYCYEGMDRWAKREFHNRWFDARDYVVGRLQDGEDYNQVYEDYLEKFLGRKPNQRNGATDKRMQMWQRIANGDVEAMPRSALASVAARDQAWTEHPEWREQLRNADGYAQSASYAKKNIAYTAYDGHILKWSDTFIKQLNSDFGMRMYSFSDFSKAFILENMQMVTDAAVKGLKGLSYTKEADFVKIFAPTGMLINCSIFGMNGRNGIERDEMQGMKWDEAKALREKYPNVGVIFVATNDQQVEWGLDQDWIDVVIPFHTVKTGEQIAAALNFTNYKGMQEDRKLPGWDKTKHVKSISPAMHNNDLETYLRLCEENRLAPRFPEWMNHPNYMKLVVETRMPYNEAQPLQPTFDISEVETMLDDFVRRGGFENEGYGSVKIPLAEVSNRLADAFVKDGGATYSAMPMRSLTAADFDDYMDAVNRNDMETADRLRRRWADERGYTRESYHGTMNGGFTEFDKAYANPEANSGAGFYSTTDYDDADSHYRDVEGADNYFKRSALAEQIMESGEWDGEYIDDYDEAYRIATEELNRNPQLYELRFRTENPYTRNFNDSDNISLYDDAVEYAEENVQRDEYADEDDYNDDYNQYLSDYLFENIDSAVRNAITDIDNSYEVIDDIRPRDIDNLVNAIFNVTYDYGGLNYDDIESAVLNNAENYSVLRPNGTNAEFAGAELTRAIIENLGYDAIIDKEVDRKFNQVKAIPGTEHYIAFNPSQYKLNDTVTYDDQGNVIPLDQRYNPNSNDIRRSLRRSDEEWDQQYFDALNRGDREEAYRLRLAHAAERGYTDRLYHGTQEFGFTVPDTSVSDDKLSFFTTDDLITAQTYSGYDNLRTIENQFDPEAFMEEYERQEKAAKSELVDFVSKANSIVGIRGWQDIDDLWNEVEVTAEEEWNHSHDLYEVYDSVSEMLDGTIYAVYDAQRLTHDLESDEYDEDGFSYDDDNNIYDSYEDWEESDEAEELFEYRDKLLSQLDVLFHLNYSDQDAGIYDLLVNPEGLYTFDAGGRNWNNITVPEDMQPKGYNLDDYRRGSKLTTRGLAQYAKDLGFEGFDVTNLIDDGGRGNVRSRASRVVDLFNPQRQAKSADMITYDDRGNIIPLSQRDNPDDPDIRRSLRTADPPKKTKTAYKLMRLMNGKLYPLFIGNNEAIEIGQWYDAESPNLENLKNLAPGTHLLNMQTGEAISWDDYKNRISPEENGKPNRKTPNVKDIHWANDNGYRFMEIVDKSGSSSAKTLQQKYGDPRAYYNWGVNGSSKTESGEGSASLYALRPGWHFGEVPSMRQIGYKGDSGENDMRLDNQVWVEVAMAADRDYNDEARANASGDIPTHIPVDGYYQYATNPTQKKSKGGNTANDLTKGNWYVAGSFMPVRILSDSEADAIVNDYNMRNGTNIPLDYRRAGNRMFNANTMQVEDAPRRSLRMEDEIPEQANAFPDRNYPQDRSAMRTLGKIYREQGRDIDPGATDEVSPEKMSEPDSYRVLMEDIDEDYVMPEPTEEDLSFYQSLVPNGKAKGGNKVGASLGFNTIEQAFDNIAGRDTEARKVLDDTFIKPLYEAKRNYVNGKETNLRALYDLAKKLDIWSGTKESAAVQWYGEGYKTEDGKQIPYTLDDLKKDFPDKWQDIVEFEQFARKTYEGYVPRWNTMFEQVYPDPEERPKKNLDKWKKDLRTARDILNITNPNDIEKITRWTEEANNLERKIADTQRKLDNGDYLVGKRLKPRKDYFHHFNEVETQGIKGLKNLVIAAQAANGKGNIDPELAGRSEWTQPRSKWMSMLQRRGNGEYTADAVKGLAKYIENAEYAIAFDPVIAQYRDEINKIRKATKQTKNANTMIDYLSDYTNHLAGKTSYLDRAARKILGGEGNRQNIANFFIRLNNRAKSNAVMGNLQSILKQASNLPNGIANVKSPTAWAKGIADWGKNIPNRLAGKEVDGAPIDQSVFLNERYFDLNTRDFEARDTVWKKMKGKTSDFANLSMEFLDKIVAEQIWSAAYYEGVEKGVDDPIYYADDLTKRSVAGRGVGEVPYAMDSAVTKFFMPFQVEVNNQWQGLKGMIRNKDAAGLITLALASYVVDGIYGAIGLGGVVPNLVGALVDGLKKLFDKDREETVGEVALDTGKRLAGETISYMPGTTLWLPAVMSSDTSEALFGEADPTRYGTGTVGLSSVAKTIADAVDGDGQFDLMSPLLQLGLPSGGRQASRLYNTLQDMNILPSNGTMNTPFGGEKNPTRGDYSKAGALKYQLPEEVDSFGDAAEIARAFLFGSNATNAAQEYFDTLKPVLNKTQVEKLKENPEVDPQTYIDYVHQANVDGKNGISQAEAHKWLSDHDLSDEERNALWSMTNSAWTKTYDEYTPQNETIVENADTNGDGRVTQAEAYSWLSRQDDISDEEKNAMWDENGWSTSYDKYDKAHKGVLGYNRKTLTEAVDQDGNGMMKQQELYFWLQNQGYTEQEKADLWDLAGWKTDYQSYNNKMKSKTPTTETTRKVKSMDELMGKEAPKSPSGITNRKELLIAADTNNDGYMSQKEAYAYLSNTDLSEEEKEALWNLSNWKTSYQKYAQKNG